MRRARPGRVACAPRAARTLAVFATCFGLLHGAALASADDSAVEAASESGPVRATVRLTPDAPRIGDPLQLELEVVAEEGVELLMPEFGEALDRFAVVDFAPSERIDDQGRTVARQRYTLQPSRSGALSIPPLLVEFVDRRPGRPPTPEGEDAYELLTERLSFEVASVLATDSSLELMPARGELGPLQSPAGPVWPWLLAGAAVLAAAAPFVFRNLADRLARSRKRSAYQVARADLDALLYGPRPSSEDAAAVDAFYVTLSGIVRRYLEDRFGLHSPEQTTDEFLEDLSRSPDLERGHQELLQEFLVGADLVKFAHRIPDADGLNASVGLAQRFLEETGEARDA
jgi:hypothetical protein